MLGIQTDNLSKVYRGKRRCKILALDRLNLNISQGEVFGFLGPNGAGKSTTIKLLMGLIRPTSGSASILGKDSGDYRSRLRVGYLPENPSFYDFLSADEYVSFVARSFGLRGNDLMQRQDEVLKCLGLWDARKRPLRSYSKGMVQRLGLAQVLVHDPDIYLLDEPMSGLDPLGRALVKEIILDLRSRGKTVLFSSHVTSDVEAVATQVGVVLSGCMKVDKPLAEICRNSVGSYRVHYRDLGTDILQETEVNEQELVALQAVVGREFRLIEPVVTDLESFFLQLVREG